MEADRQFRSGRSAAGGQRLWIWPIAGSTSRPVKTQEPRSSHYFVACLKAHHVVESNELMWWVRTKG